MKSEAQKIPARKPATAKQGWLDQRAELAEAAGRQAMQSLGPIHPARTMTEHSMPKFSDAPKGSRVIGSSRGCVALASPQGFYLGLFSLDEV